MGTPFTLIDYLKNKFETRKIDCVNLAESRKQKEIFIHLFNISYLPRYSLMFCTYPMISLVERACSSSVDFSSMSYKTNSLIELSVFFDIVLNPYILRFSGFNRTLLFYLPYSKRDFWQLCHFSLLIRTVNRNFVFLLIFSKVKCCLSFALSSYNALVNQSFQRVFNRSFTYGRHEFHYVALRKLTDCIVYSISHQINSR